MLNQFKVNYASEIDLRKIAKCHTLAFPNSLSSAMGLKYLTKMFGWYVSAPNKFIFWIEKDGMCIGYCGGYLMDGTDATGAASGMTQFSFYSAVLSILIRPWLLFHSELMNKYRFIFSNILRKIGLMESRPFNIVDPSRFEKSKLATGLIVIGTHPDFQGNGVGSILLKEFERISISMGSKQMELSVLVNNIKAISTYVRNGYSIFYTTSTSHRMRKVLE